MNETSMVNGNVESRRGQSRRPNCGMNCTGRATAQLRAILQSGRSISEQDVTARAALLSPRVARGLLESIEFGFSIDKDTLRGKCRRCFSNCINEMVAKLRGGTPITEDDLADSRLPRYAADVLLGGLDFGGEISENHLHRVRPRGRYATRNMPDLGVAEEEALENI